LNGYVFARCRGFAALLWAMSAFPAFAAEQSASPSQNLTDLSLQQLLEMPVQLVYAASKYEQKVARAPASVSIVTADEIRRHGFRTLADVLRSMRGVYISNDRNYTYLGMRGFLRPGDYNSRVLLLIDGHRMNDNIYSGTYVGREGAIDVSTIERVEFVRGPGSSIYGSNAFFGIVNVITKGAEQAQGLEISGDAGTLDSYEGRVSYANRFTDQASALLTGSYYTSDGQDKLYFREFDPRVSDDPRAANNGIAQGLDSEDAFNLFGKLQLNEFTVSAFFTSRNKQVPTASFDTLFNDPSERTRDRHGYFDLKYEHHYSANLSVLGRTFYDHYEYSGGYPYDYGVLRDAALGEWAGTEWQLTGKLFDRHAFVTGVEYRENLRAQQLSYDDLTPRVYYVDSDERSRDVGVFVQDEISLTTHVLLNAGLRYDHYFEGFGGTLNPRMGLIYAPDDNRSFKALYGQAFRAPTPFEQFYYLGTQERQALEPETIRTYELAYQQTLNRHHRLDVSLFHYDIEDLISQITNSDGDTYYANLSRARAKGIEIEVEGRYDNGIQAQLSYTLQRAEDAVTGEELSSSPRGLAKFNLLAPLAGEKLSLGAELLFQGSMRTLASSRESSFWIGNLTLTSRWPVMGLEIAGGVYNVLDAQYGYVGAEEHLQDVIQQDGRTYRVKLTKRFGAR
jgi:outer membrane receptor for ferrienterochelin and colicins